MNKSNCVFVLLFISFYCPLLSENQKLHIQQFAAESFAFLLRKAKNHDSVFDAVLLALESMPDLWQGIGFLLAEMCKGVKKQFHSCTEKLLPHVLRKLGPFQDKEEMASHLPWNLVRPLCSRKFQKVEYYSK